MTRGPEAQRSLTPFVRRFIKEMQDQIHRGKGRHLDAYDAFIKVCERRKLDPHSNIGMTICNKIFEVDPIFDMYY